MLTRSLAIKLKTECLARAPELQAACLADSRDSLLLADSHSSLLAETLLGAPTDLAFQLAATPQGGYGYYSPYIGVVRDLARIFGAFQSTQLRYIPALARARDDRIELLLNAVPSFAKPKSVMVVALPAVEPAAPPPLRPSEPDRAFCATLTPLVLPVEGAPLIYATQFAHDMALRLVKADGSTVDLPVEADPEKGGYVLKRKNIDVAGFGNVIDATLHGTWGFSAFDGPSFRLQNPSRGKWQPISTDSATLVVGRDNSLILQGASPTCIDSITLRQASGAALPIQWKADAADRIVVALPLAHAAPGKMTLLVGQLGIDAPEAVPLTALSEVGRIDGFTLHAGDSTGVLLGTRLDTIASASVDKLVFRPAELTRAGKVDRLSLVAADGGTAALFSAGQEKSIKVVLVDGRTRIITFVIATPRPTADIIGKSIERTRSNAALPITVSDENAVTQDARLTFSLRAQGATRFSGRDSVEIATADARATATVTSADGVVMQNDRIAVVTVEPAHALGVSAYGPLRVRILQDGVAGDWMPLATLVRLPALTSLSCKQAKESCKLTGAGLYLIDSISNDPAFANAISVPEGFTGNELSVPSAVGGKLFLRLRDAPDLSATATYRPE